MKRTIIILGAFSFLAACSTATPPPDNGPKPKSTVQVTGIQSGSVGDSLILSAISNYMKRNMVTAPIASFITKVNVQLGDHVRQGQPLYLLESKERRALGSGIGKVDSTLTNFGLITVNAPSDGIVTTFDKQQTGEYVLEGTLLCTIAASKDLAFQVNVPFEYTEVVKPGRKCMITLPDGTVHRAIITTPLATMNVMEQTQVLLARPDNSLLLPENLMAKVQFDKSVAGMRQVLPKACVLSDELLKNFWIMKLINDSTAVKVPVQTGNKNNQFVEIVSPRFTPTDRILITGNYGQSDTAAVTVVK